MKYTAQLTSNTDFTIPPTKLESPFSLTTTSDSFLVICSAILLAAQSICLYAIAKQAM